MGEREREKFQTEAGETELRAGGGEGRIAHGGCLKQESDGTGGGGLAGRGSPAVEGLVY